MGEECSKTGIVHKVWTLQKFLSFLATPSFFVVCISILTIFVYVQLLGIFLRERTWTQDQTNQKWSQSTNSLPSTSTIFMKKWLMNTSIIIIPITFEMFLMKLGDFSLNRNWVRGGYDYQYVNAWKKINPIQRHIPPKAIGHENGSTREVWEKYDQSYIKSGMNFWTAETIRARAYHKCPETRETPGWNSSSVDSRPLLDGKTSEIPRGPVVDRLGNIIGQFNRQKMW